MLVFRELFLMKEFNFIGLDKICVLYFVVLGLLFSFSFSFLKVKLLLIRVIDFPDSDCLFSSFMKILSIFESVLQISSESFIILVLCYDYFYYFL